jgi:AbrB family looped-hinge helix DNA binding protein
VGKVILTRSAVDAKGRVILPKPFREMLGISAGSEVSVELDRERLIISRTLDADDFIRDMEGFVKHGSTIPLTDPLSLKRIWEKA